MDAKDLAAIKVRWANLAGLAPVFGREAEVVLLDDFPALVAEVERRQRLHTPIESYACQRCGRADGLDAVASNEVWAALTGGRVLGPSGEVGDGCWELLCLWCMDELAAQKRLTQTVSLFFAGRALTGTSQSEADEAHIRRLVEQRAAALAQVERLTTERDDWRATAEAYQNPGLRAALDDPDTRYEPWVDGAPASSTDAGEGTGTGETTP